MNKISTGIVALAAALGGASQSFADPTGVIQTYSTQGPVDTSRAFFQSLGTNGRTCATCHIADEAMGISATGVQERFFATRGRDPLFAPVDGANCPSAKQGGARAHSLLQPASASQVADIVSFERSLYTAQKSDLLAGDLTAEGGLGGPLVLARQAYQPGINDAGAVLFNTLPIVIVDVQSGAAGLLLYQRSG